MLFASKNVCFGITQSSNCELAVDIASFSSKDPKGSKFESVLLVMLFTLYTLLKEIGSGSVCGQVLTCLRKELSVDSVYEVSKTETFCHCCCRE